jgi:hypothetical protein
MGISVRHLRPACILILSLAVAGCLGLSSSDSATSASSSDDLILKASKLNPNQTSGCLPLRFFFRNSASEDVDLTHGVSLQVFYDGSEIELYTDKDCSQAAATSDKHLPAGRAEGFYYYNATTYPDTTKITTVAVNDDTSQEYDDQNPGDETNSNTHQIVMSFLAAHFSGGTCTPMYGYAAMASDGTGVTLNNDIDISISVSAPTGQGKFYSDASCTNEITTVNMTAGSGAMDTFYFKTKSGVTYNLYDEVWIRAQVTYADEAIDTFEEMIIQ